ncbi:MAG: hypothetical protein IJR87_12795, partial [Bacteroidaceae bacterium]|nr:hypothetical protein [Bacteroidaceae bacterium]
MNPGQLERCIREIAFETQGRDAIQLNRLFAVLRKLHGCRIIAEPVTLGNKIVVSFRVFQHYADEAGLARLLYRGIDTECIDGTKMFQRYCVGGRQVDVHHLLDRCLNPCL